MVINLSRFLLSNRCILYPNTQFDYDVKKVVRETVCRYIAFLERSDLGMEYICILNHRDFQLHLQMSSQVSTRGSETYANSKSKSSK